MSTSAFRYPNHPPMLHRPEPIREGFAWWRKIHVSCPLLRRKIGDICFETVRHGRCHRPADRLIGQVKRQANHSNPHSPSPILTRPSTSRGFLPRGLSDACPQSSAGILVALCLRAGI